tara:strand:- start:188 stop:640 length:453 start_codon:yes stop_codon:yes gene_type:complete
MNKKINIIIITSIIMFSCNSVPNPKLMCYDLIIDNGIEMLDNKPFSGSCYTVYEENQEMIDEIKSFNGGIMHGVWAKYYITGQLKYRGIARKGNIHGLYKLYREDGTLSEKGKFKEGYRDGVWKYYNLAEKIEKTEFYQDREFIGEEYKN